MSERIILEPAGQLDKDIVERASSSILILPDNWDAPGETPVYRTSAEAVYKLFKSNGLPCEYLGEIDATTQLRDNRSLDWVSPVILVTSLLLSQNPSAISLALGIVANYITDIFKGIKKDPKVKLTVIHSISKDSKNRKLHYEGPVSGLEEVRKTLSQFDSER